MRLGLFLLLTSNAAYGAPAVGRPSYQAPIDRVIKNLTYHLRTAHGPAEIARLELNLGRLHAMASNGQTEAPTFNESEPYTLQGDDVVNTLGDPQTVYNTPRPSVVVDRTEAQRKHLRQAIFHLKKAYRLEPTSAPAALSLAWNLTQAHQNDEAREVYRAVVANGWREIAAHDDPGVKELVKSPGRLKERNLSTHLVQTLEYYHSSPQFSYVSEAAMYLIPLLGEKSDAAEIADLRKKIETLEQYNVATGAIGWAVEPIIIPLTPQTSVSRLITPKYVLFDLGGFGARDFGPWPSANAGWLVWDPYHTAKVLSGRQLFGSVTYWLFWDNGYQALSALDDDHDSKLEGKELEGLAIWQDLNGDGIVQRGELHSLAYWGITSISCAAKQDATGMWYSPQGVTFTNGEVRPTYDLILTPQAPTIEAPVAEKTTIPQPVKTLRVPFVQGVAVR